CVLKAGRRSAASWANPPWRRSMCSRNSVSLRKCVRHLELIRSVAGGWPRTSAVAALGFRRGRLSVLVAIQYRGTAPAEINPCRTGADGEFAPLRAGASGTRFGEQIAVGERLIGPAQKTKQRKL